MPKEIIITVEGFPNTGKEIICDLIAKSLVDAGLNNVSVVISEEDKDVRKTPPNILELLRIDHPKFFEQIVRIRYKNIQKLNITRIVDERHDLDDK